MGLFGFGKKKEESCCCGGSCAAENVKPTEGGKPQGVRVKVLGSGCTKCNQLEAATKTALERLGMDTSVEHVSDFSQIAAYGVMTTPALVVDEKVVSFGKVLHAEEIMALLKHQQT